MPQDASIKKIENDLVKFWIEDGILYSEFKQEINISLEKAKILIELRHRISNNEKQYWCYDFTRITSFSKESMNYAEIYGQEYLHASAAIVKSHIAKFVFNSFILFRKAKVPFRMFTTKEKAVIWLKELKKNTNNRKK